MKRILQTICALLYTPIYTGIMYVAIVYPIMWVLTLSFWKMIVAIIILGGLIEGLIAFLQSIGVLPYAWIVKQNNFARWISMVLCVLLPLFNGFSLWASLISHGLWGIVCAIILSIMLIQFVIGSIVCISGFYYDD